MAKKYAAAKTLDLHGFVTSVAKDVARRCPGKFDLEEVKFGIFKGYRMDEAERGDTTEIRIAFRVAQEKRMGSVLKASVSQARKNRKRRSKTFKDPMMGERLRSVELSRTICEYLMS